MPVHVPKGFRVAGVHCGIKRDPEKEDLTLIVADRPAVAAGVYTRNQVVAASVTVCRERTPSDSILAVVASSGNANACTGPQGDRDARQVAHWAADACGAQPRQALVLATGVIGEPLPMERIREGVAAASGRLATDDAALAAAARGILTTDTAVKLHGCRTAIDGAAIELAGMAKGAAMIGPNLATMLAVVMTDARLTADAAQAMLLEAVGQSFNAISVDGHMSTNDSVLLLASGAAGGGPLAGQERVVFQRGLDEVCQGLARAIVADGEGATHTIEIAVVGCESREAAHQIAKTVADSPLVKTAIAGADPNWGRIVSAAGYAGVPFDPAGVRLEVNGHLLYERGTPVAFDAEAVSRSIRGGRDVRIELRFSEGSQSVRFWTTDLTAEYVRLNSEYTT